MSDDSYEDPDVKEGDLHSYDSNESLSESGEGKSSESDDSDDQDDEKDVGPAKKRKKIKTLRERLWESDNGKKEDTIVKNEDDIETVKRSIKKEEDIPEERVTQRFVSKLQKYKLNSTMVNSETLTKWEPHINEFTTMGFTRQEAIKSLKQNNGSIQQSLDYLLRILRNKFNEAKLQSQKSKVSRQEEFEEDLEKLDDGSKSARSERLERRSQIRRTNIGKDDKDIDMGEPTDNLEGLIDQCEEISIKINSLLEEAKLGTSSNVDSYERPKTLATDMNLTDYQIRGLNWLYLLHEQNLSGILADEMGLGKTIQTIALLTLLKEKNKVNIPHMIVVPTTTIYQWQSEILKWSPSLFVELYHGPLDERIDRQDYLKNGGYDILLTTYPIINGNNDRRFLKSLDFHYMILDEAQNIKNQESKRYKILYKMSSKRRLLLTGTPLQNNLEELWALLNFLMPQKFSLLKLENYKQVFQTFLKSSGKNHRMTESEYITRLKKILAPFILRRLKSQVADQLPEKVTKIAKCKMPEYQSKKYNEIYNHSKNVLKDTGDKRGVIEDDKGQKFSLHNFLNNTLMQLRKTANHPVLTRGFYTDKVIGEIAAIIKEKDPIYKDLTVQEVEDEIKLNSDWEIHRLCVERNLPFQLKVEDWTETSAKFVKLKSLLDKLHHEGHRALIFSQMTKMLDVLEAFLTYLGYSYVRMDGSTGVADRQNLINAYNSDHSIFIFLLSTRAGGLGVNLTSADTVIFYDISYNPQVDRQAEDRCHRLGQTKTVQIIKLVVEDTCEQHILDMATEKKELNDIMLDEGKYEGGEEVEISSKYLLTILNGRRRKKKKRSNHSTKRKSSKKSKKRKRSNDGKKKRSSKSTKKKSSSVKKKSKPSSNPKKKSTTRTIDPMLDKLQIRKDNADS